MRVGILGLGEAGSKIAADLAQSGHDYAGTLSRLRHRHWSRGRAQPRGRRRRRGGDQPDDGRSRGRRGGGRWPGPPAASGVRRPEHVPPCQETGGRRHDRSAGALFADVALLGSVPRRGIDPRRSPPARERNGSQRCSGQWGCAWTSWAPEAGRRRGTEAPAERLHEGACSSDVESLRAAEQYGRRTGCERRSPV